MTDIPGEIMQRAREAILSGVTGCPRFHFWQTGEMKDDCGCEEGKIDGCLTKNEAIARAIMESEARGYARAKEQAAKVADDIMTAADGKFDLRVLRAKQGEGNLELAAACAAGMSHAAREIATAILAMEDK
jgi:hypothetical protein